MQSFFMFVFSAIANLLNSDCKFVTFDLYKIESILLVCMNLACLYR